MAGCRLKLDTTYTGSVKENRSSIFKILLEYGAPIDVSSSDGDLPVHTAFSICKTRSEIESNLDDMMTMIDLSENVNKPGTNGSTPFLTVTQLCSIDVIKRMVDKGAYFNSKGTDGNTALHVVIGKLKLTMRFINILI